MTAPGIVVNQNVDKMLKLPDSVRQTWFAEL